MNMIALIHKIKIVGAIAALLTLSSCYDKEQKASEDATTRSRGVEYAPQMYHAESYEPLSQVTDKSAGLEYWPFEEVGGGESDYDSLAGHGEWYNSNYYNKHGMNMRHPVAGTVARGQGGFDYNINPDSSSQWAAVKSPFEGNGAAIEDGAILYQRFCQHCHGEEGDGKGAVGVIFKGVPSYHTRKDLLAMSKGEIYRTITFGRNTMRAHAAQLDPEERWKLAEYIKAWQAEVAASKVEE